MHWSVRIWRSLYARRQQEREPGWPSTCSACTADLSSVPRGRPCPSCGKSLRTYRISVAANVTAQAAMAGFDITYPVTRSWREKWHKVLRELEAIEDAYVGLAGAPADWKGRVVQFCEDCYHLKDWLKNDQSIAQSVRDAVEVHAHGSAAIELAGHVINTDKHYARQTGRTSAHVSSIRLRDLPGSVSTFITIESVSAGVVHSTDARDLARQAVADWRAFFVANGLSER